MTPITTVRRSLLYVPGDRPEMLQRAGQRGADSLILNLEDAVAVSRKDLARDAVLDALRNPKLAACERIVRINPARSATGYRDLLAVVPAVPHAILLPKVSTAEEVRFVSWTIDQLEAIHDLPRGGIGLMCMIESAGGVLEARHIAGASERVKALVFGAADYAEDVGLRAGAEASILVPALTQVVLAARTAGVDAIDAPHMRPDDPDGLRDRARLARDLGFDGKSAIHPSQVPVINDIFSPQPEEIAWAQRVLEALSASGEDMGAEGAALLDGELVEAPHVLRARRILNGAASIAMARAEAT